MSMDALIVITKACPRCGARYSREIEPEWAAVVARWGVCDACYQRQEAWRET